MSDDISRIQQIIDHALADGRLSKKESESIKRAIYADNKVTPEEAELWRKLQDKIVTGEILLD